MPALIQQIHSLFNGPGRSSDIDLRLRVPVLVPGYIAESEYAIIETNLYETDNDKLVWAASSETLIGDSDKSLIKSFIGIMVNTMVAQGLLGK